jgi:hypothetical protein
MSALISRGVASSLASSTTISSLRRWAGTAA